MVKTTIPNRSGDYEVDGISIIVLPEKIIIDTGSRRTDERRFRRDDDRRTGRREKKDGGVLNTIMENAHDLATGKKSWGR